MRTRIADLKRSITLGLLLAGTTALISCASQKEQMRLVNDPDDHGDSAIPWNKQEQWETGGQFANMTDRR
jgi:hypothetical protein